jgi:hypothetical protein
MGKHRVFIIATLAEAAALVGLISWCLVASTRWTDRELPAQQAVARRLELTDLALWTEARYTRHPSQADRFAPFQDFPSSLEHFPAGSVVAPPDSWRDAPGER